MGGSSAVAQGGWENENETVFNSMTGFFTDACGVIIGFTFAPIHPGPAGAYIVRDVGNPVPIIMLQGRDPTSFYTTTAAPRCSSAARECQHRQTTHLFSSQRNKEPSD